MCLQHNTHLLELTCGFNGIGDDGFVDLAAAVASSTSIRKLHLAGNTAITSVGTAAMVAALHENASLTEYGGDW